ncbi:hypothetical protein GCM10007160_08640 [Litchfieldella qijiaojingensis]|uniref:Uncharacterized protein n=2 Tax=Litchfieldella qijiaojingensis TaxID=980347 RepID=A0ABQ2YGJ7_9GAMM|nr:hypothetical protein GCM10007160_08640 [Halomonas qijiaojingensis]
MILTGFGFVSVCVLASDHPQLKLGVEPGEVVIGSDANVGMVNVGATYALSHKTSIVTNVGIGLTDDASDVTLNFRMPYQL